MLREDRCGLSLGIPGIEGGSHAEGGAERAAELRVGGDTRGLGTGIGEVDTCGHLVEIASLGDLVEEAVVGIRTDGQTLVVGTVPVTADDTFLLIVTD